MKRINKTVLTVGVILISLAAALGQSTSLQIIHTAVGDEGAIVLTWESESNAVYRIEYATELLNAGTAWRTLYEDYPSHGTNTLWMDNGNYLQSPPIKRPKDEPMRIYRVVKTGTNTDVAPFVSVTFPASNSVVSGELIVSVVATSTLPVVRHRLFVDGLEMRPSDDGTNYVVNTSEWGNGPHVIFASALAASRFEGLPGNFTVTYGRAVSAYVPVIFSNYISQIYFSEPFFEPNLGQTQRVSAVFEDYSAWTLQILDDASNAVRTATGEGRTALFAWDGTGDGGASIPDGAYQYLFTATATNELPQAPGGGGGSPPSPLMAAMAAGQSSYFIAPPPMPPVKKGADWYSWEEVFGPLPFTEVKIQQKSIEKFLNPAPASLSSPAMMNGQMLMAAVAPNKPPTAGMKKPAGTIGIAYYRYAGGASFQPPLNGSGIPGQRVQIQGSSSASFTVPSLATIAKGGADEFVFRMEPKAWKVLFNKADPAAIELKRADLSIGGSNIFNQANIGLLLSHGAYGTSIDFTPAASVSLQTYIPAGGTNNPANTWIRFSEFKFGTGSSAQLKWMAINACSLLRDENYQSMDERGVLPIGNKLHLLCSATTVMLVGGDITGSWATKMLQGETVKEAWFNGGRLGHAGQTVIPGTVILRVAGHAGNFNDTLKNNSEPGGGIDFEDRPVWP